MLSSIKPIKDRVIVSDMHFGEQITDSGILIKDDDGTTRGVHPRWAQVFDKGPSNIDEYEIGDWVLVEHGRWTRSFDFFDSETQRELELRMVDPSAIIMVSDDKPKDIMLGKEYTNGELFRPESFTDNMVN